MLINLKLRYATSYGDIYDLHVLLTTNACVIALNQLCFDQKKQKTPQNNYAIYWALNMG